MIVVEALDGYVKASLDGEIEHGDFDSVGEVVDGLIEEQGKINLLLDGRDFSGWDNFQAAREHLSFVKHHHSKIQRLAVVTKHQWQHWLAGIAAHVVDAQIKAFDTDHIEAAQHWVETGELQPSVSIASLNHGRVLHIKVTGKLTGVDYANVLKPVMSEAIEATGKVSFLIDMSDFEGMDMDAFWQDARFGLGNISHIDKLAILGDSSWLDWVAKVTDAVTPIEVGNFSKHELAKAKEFLGLGFWV